MRVVITSSSHALETKFLIERLSCRVGLPHLQEVGRWTLEFMLQKQTGNPLPAQAGGNCQIEDLTDPGLGLLKRRILAKSNDLLGKPLLRSVVFSDFSFVEQ